MLDESVAVRYAKTFYAIAFEKEKTEAWKEQLQKTITSIKESEFLFKFLHSPCINKKSKKEVINKLFSNRLDTPVLNLIKILIDKNRIAYIEFILEMYKKQIMTEKGITQALVKTAAELPVQEKERLQNALSKFLKSKVEAQFTVDPKIIAGTTIMVDGKIIDWSVSRKLEEIKDIISRAPVLELKS